MASETREFELNLAPEPAYHLVRQAGTQLPGFRLSYERQDQGFLQFERLLGWSNPMRVEARLEIRGDQRVGVKLTAQLLAFLDPLGFMKGALDMFEEHLRGCAEAAAQNAPWPKAPSYDKRGLQGTLVLLAVLVVIGLGIVGFVVLVLVMAR